jgi:hypothetical protein
VLRIDRSISKPSRRSQRSASGIRGLENAYTIGSPASASRASARFATRCSTERREPLPRVHGDVAAPGQRFAVAVENRVPGGRAEANELAADLGDDAVPHRGRFVTKEGSPVVRRGAPASRPFGRTEAPARRLPHRDSSGSRLARQQRSLRHFSSQRATAPNPAQKASIVHPHRFVSVHSPSMTPSRGPGFGDDHSAA